MLRVVLMVDVDSIKGCTVQSETVFHCSEASQSTTKVTEALRRNGGPGEFLG